MALTLTKTTQAISVDIPKVEPALTPLTATAALVEEYLVMYRKLEEIGGKDLLKRMEDIKQSLAKEANATAADSDGVIFWGPTGALEFSSRTNKVEIKDLDTMDTLLSDLEEKFDHSVVLSVVNVALTPLRKVLSEVELAKYTKTVPGSRTLKNVKLDT